MEELEKYLGRCYLESGKDYIFVYRLAKFDDGFGFRAHRADKPSDIEIYDDHFKKDVEELKEYIPDLNPECDAKEISEDRYKELITEMEGYQDVQKILEKDIKNFIKKNGLE